MFCCLWVLIRHDNIFLSEKQVFNFEKKEYSMDWVSYSTWGVKKTEFEEG